MTIRFARLAVAIVTALGVSFMLAPAAANAATEGGHASSRTARTAAQTTDSRTGGQAAGAIPLTGWLGSCFPNRGRDWGGGWCDGNGPDWTYRGWVRCSGDTTLYLGSARWAGDRTGSYAYCPTGRTATVGGLKVYGGGALYYTYSV